MNRLTLAAMLAASVLFACDCGNTGSGTNTGKVRGYVVGRVTDSMTGAPLASVAVKAWADTAVTVSTDADGAYVIKDLPLGGLTVSFELTGYVRALCTPFIDTANGAEGNILSRCDMVMAKGDGKLEGFVVTPDGKPVSGMTLVTDLRSVSGPSLQSGYDMVTTSTTAADGSFAFAGLPITPRGTSVSIFFPPFDVNGDGEPDVSATTRNATVYPGPAIPFVFVIGNNSPNVVVSNVADNELAPGDAITITWSTPLDTANAVVTLTDQTRNIEVPVEKTWTSGISLSAKPANGNQLLVGTRYQLAVSAKAVGVSGAPQTYNFPFVVRASNITPITAQVTGLTLSAPAIPAHSSTGFTLAFTGAIGATGYKVFAKDTQLNTDWVLVTAFAGSASGTVYRAFNLPTQFDAYLFDGNVWPLANGNRITFAVTPFDAYGNDAPLASAPTVQVQDLAAPTWTSLGASVGDAVNDTSTAVKVTVPVVYSEPMKPGTPPQLVTASGLAATWTWANDYQGGFFTVTIPPNTNGAEGFVVRGGEDQNGNKLSNGEAAGHLTGIQDFLTNTGFEDNNCSTSGWTGGSTGGPPALGAPAASTATFSTGKCSAAIGSINGSAAGVGTSRLSQQFTVPLTVPAGRSLVMGVRYRLASDGSPATASGTLRCGIMDSTMTAYGITLFSFFPTQQNAFTTQQSGVTLTPGTTYNAVCEATITGSTPAEFGLWVDDVQVGVLFN